MAKINLQETLLNQKIQETKNDWEKSEVELEIEIKNIILSSTYYHKYIGGWLERREGVIFDNWIEGKFDTTLPYCFGMDLGFSPDPLALVKVAVDNKKKRIYVKEYIYETELVDVSARLRKLNVNKNALIVCDTNEGRLVKKIKSSGFNIKKAKKSKIYSDIIEIKGYLIIVDPKSYNIKGEFNTYDWNDKRASIPNDTNNHSCDAIRYGFRLLAKKKSRLRKKN